MKKLAIFWIVLVTIALAGCGVNKPPQVTMRIGVTESLDAYPVQISYSAEAFTTQNIDLRLTMHKTTREIGDALARGDLDAGMIDLPAALVLAASANPVQIVRVAMQATPERAMYVIITRRDSPVTTLKQLDGKTLALSADLGEQYVAEQFFAGAGLNFASVKHKQVVDASVGVDLLRKGEVDAALVPEILTWGPLSRETKALTSPTKSQVGESVLVASAKFIAAQPDGLKRFMVAYEAGIRAVLWDPEPYRPILAKSGVPKELVSQFGLPVYPLAQLPTESEIEQANAWLSKQGLLSAPVAYKSAGTSAFLPDPSLVEQAIFCHRP